MIYAVFLLIAVLMYALAPLDYSQNFNIAILGLYVFAFSYTFKRQKIKALSYPTLFFAIFFFVNFAYPVFIYPYDELFIIQFKYSFSPKYINAGSALSLIAFIAFLSGYVWKKRSTVIDTEHQRVFSNKYYSLFTFAAILVFIYNLYIIIPQIGISYGDAKVPFQTGSLFVMMESTLSLIICNLYKNEIKGDAFKFFRHLKLHILLCSLFALVCLLLGSREYILTLSLLYVLLYSYYVKPINMIKMCIGLFVGLMAFYSISQMRNNVKIESSKEFFELKPWQNGKVSGAWNLATDLIINNRNLYVGMQFVDDPNHGYTFGYHFIPNFLSPIPLLPSLFTKYVMNTSVVDLTSQQMLTYYTRDGLGESSLDYELGTNCVVDVFMALGLFGVIVLFFYLGYLIKYLERNSESSALAFCIYIILFTSIVFFCRGSFLGPIKNVVWSYWVFCLCMRKVRYIPNNQKRLKPL